MAEISVIIPTFNRSQFLGETLDSVLAQTYQDWECIVVDDGSKDHTLELMNFYIVRDKRFKYFHRPPNRKKGANACRNFGFEKSSGNYIVWCDSDDLMKTDKLESQLIRLKNSDANYCIAYAEIFDNEPHENLGVRFQYLQSSNLMLDYAKMKLGWMTPSILWKREFLSRIPRLFDEELKAAQEWEFHLRIIASDTNFCTIERSLDLVRKHVKSITYNSVKSEREWFYFLARLKIYTNREIELDRDTNNYLKNYLLDRFKRMITTQDKFVFKIYQKFILPEADLNNLAKFNALLAMSSFKLLGKGNYFLQRIKYFK